MQRLLIQKKMSCKKCNTKSYKGKIGDAGADGDDGIDGVNGIYLLENIIAPVVTTSGALQDMMTYTLQQAGTSLYPFQNGDMLEIETRFTSTNNSDTKLVRLYFGSQLISVPLGVSGYNTGGITLKTTLTRVDATTIIAEENSIFTSLSSVYPIVPLNGEASLYDNAIPPVPDMDTTDIVIKTQGDGVNAGDLTNLYLRIKLIKHI